MPFYLLILFPYIPSGMVSIPETQIGHLDPLSTLPPNYPTHRPAKAPHGVQPKSQVGCPYSFCHLLAGQTPHLPPLLAQEPCEDQFEL